MKVCVVGAAGRMGQETCRAVMAECDLELTGAVDLAAAGRDIGDLIGATATGVMIDETIEECLARTKPDVAVDFTHPDAVQGNVRKYISADVKAVIGTTGLSPMQIAELSDEADGRNAHVLIAPNFAVGAILMMHFAAIASRFFKHAEIIELHHDKKADAPSGTSIKTAEQMVCEPLALDEKELYAGVRGARLNNVRIHSVRLPGFVAHQEVIFGGQGQTLTIRHDSIDRTSFMPGVILAIRKIGDHPGLTYGLESFLELG